MQHPRDKNSSSKRTRHINIRYYFVTDKIAQKEVSVKYCETNDMVADFFTKPLQGVKFATFRDYIMNVDDAKNFYSLPKGSNPSDQDTSNTSIDVADDRSVLDGDGNDTSATTVASVLEPVDTIDKNREEDDSNPLHGLYRLL